MWAQLSPSSGSSKEWEELSRFLCQCSWICVAGSQCAWGLVWRWSELRLAHLALCLSFSSCGISPVLTLRAAVGLCLWSEHSWYKLAAAVPASTGH